MLRIKVMQTLFSYDQCKEANYLLAIDQIEAIFQPDLNSMEVQDKLAITKQRKSAVQHFEKKFNHPDTEAHADAKINKAVAGALDFYHKQNKKDFAYFLKNIVVDVERLTDYYYAILGLMVAFREQAEADKKVNHQNLINNAWLKALAANDELKKELLKGSAGWQNKMDKVRPWFRDVIKQDNTYIKYQEQKNPDLDSQKAMVKHLYRKLILAGTINSYFEEEDIHWVEDHEIIKGLTDKTIKSFDEEAGTIQLQKLSLDWEDDRTFITKLFQQSANLDEAHKKLIANNTKNWEVDRLPLTDRIILEMAIAEMISFPNIPVKVSINEYIELTKEYSTPKSRQFINGILDVISKEMMKTGAVKKSGRGLIDNK